MSLPVVVSLSNSSKSPTSSPSNEKPAHHASDGTFVNPWPSFIKSESNGFIEFFRMRFTDWQSKPLPAPEDRPQIVKVDYGLKSGENQREWAKDIKSTWLGHAAFLVEFPAPPDSAEGTRGARILFDPIFSNRCSPSQYVGPARVTQPPFKLSELPHVDAVVISHNHYDHLDVTTLKHVYAAQPQGTIHFFAPLGNKKWFESVIGVKPEEVTELDWWEARDLKVSLGNSSTSLKIECTPSQHFTGRGINDRNHTLWASWAVSSYDPAGGSVWFAGDTAYKSVPRGAITEENLPVCPVFKEIGTKYSQFDLSMIPIGAYSPRWFMSRVHCSPEDAVDVHLAVNSKKSIGMHWGTWVLTDEELLEPPKRLAAQCEKKGIPKGEFGVCSIGETTRVGPQSKL